MINVKCSAQFVADSKYSVLAIVIISGFYYIIYAILKLWFFFNFIICILCLFDKDKGNLYPVFPKFPKLLTECRMYCQENT